MDTKIPVSNNKKQNLSGLVNALYLYVKSADLKEERAVDLINAISRLAVISKKLGQEFKGGVKKS